MDNQTKRYHSYITKTNQQSMHKSKYNAIFKKLIESLKSYKHGKVNKYL